MNPESFRIYEAFEAGSIPVITTLKHNPSFNFIDNVLGPNAPILILDDWKSAESRMKELSSDPVKLDEFQQRMVIWWRNFKIKLGDDVKRLIDRAFEQRYGPGS
jgi:hypothetical protein